MKTRNLNAVSGTVVDKALYRNTTLSELVPIPNNVGCGQSGSPVKSGVPVYFSSVDAAYN